MATQLYIGMMSGTSMDGVDAVLIEMDSTQWRGAHAHAFLPYPDSLKTALLALQHSSHNELHIASMLARQLSILYADTIALLLEKQQLTPQSITAIGCHGQTIRHAPEHGYSIQLADWALLAELSGITTVGDFRSRDLAAGGQGAPLVPAFHDFLFRSPHHHRVLLNLGGIANISVIPQDAPSFGFDTGPGNMLMDAWVNLHWQQPYDADGAHAQRGHVLPELLNRLLNTPYFQLPPPKSTGRELFQLDWLMPQLNGDERPEDVLRTLLELTAHSATDAIIRHAPNCDTVYLCGGGVGNSLLVSTLKQRLASHHIQTESTHALNLHPQWVEAAAFGWLAACWLHHIPAAPHLATGAQRPTILGSGHWA